jgi:hypothetical protein
MKLVSNTDSVFAENYISVIASNKMYYFELPNCTT